MTQSQHQIAFLDARWNHHAAFSGYHPISAGLGCAFAPPNFSIGWLGRAASKILRTPKLPYALHVARRMRKSRSRVLDILDGEQHIWLARSLARFPGVRVFCTFHHCPDDLEAKIRQVPSGSIDGAICVSRCQLPLVRRLARNGRCWFLPHGVSTDYFTPDAAVSKDPNLVLSVGVHRRDINTLCAAARLIKRERPGTRVCLVAPRAHAPAEMDVDAVDLMCDVSDADLLMMYRRSAVLLLPLEHSTANNSLLEAMACGLPLVTTDVGGVTDYVTPQCSALCPRGDAESHAAAALAVLASQPMQRGMGQASRANAERFAWPVIREGLRRILSGEQPADA